MKQPIVQKGAILQPVWVVTSDTSAFFLGHFTSTQESLAKSTFGGRRCQRGNGPKSLRIKENLAVGFGLQRLGEVDRKTVSRPDSCSTAIIAESATQALVRCPDSNRRRGTKQRGECLVSASSPTTKLSRLEVRSQ